MSSHVLKGRFSTGIRSLIPVMLVGFLGMTGCSADVAQGEPDTAHDAAVGHMIGPTKDQSNSEVGQSADPERSEDSASTPSSEAGLGEEATGQAEEDPKGSDAPLPTPAAQPQPALSEEEIRATYGSDEPEPAESMVGTLCNLNRPHLEQLSERVVAESQLDDQMLRLAALSLSDDLGVWEGMAWQVPDAAEEIETAREVYAHWEYAVALVDAGDQTSAMEEWNTATTLIAGLPAGDVTEVGC